MGATVNRVEAYCWAVAHWLGLGAAGVARKAQAREVALRHQAVAMKVAHESLTSTEQPFHGNSSIVLVC